MVLSENTVDKFYRTLGTIPFVPHAFSRSSCMYGSCHSCRVDVPGRSESHCCVTARGYYGVLTLRVWLVLHRRFFGHGLQLFSGRLAGFADVSCLSQRQVANLQQLVPGGVGSSRTPTTIRSRIIDSSTAPKSHDRASRRMSPRKTSNRSPFFWTRRLKT